MHVTDIMTQQTQFQALKQQEAEGRKERRTGDRLGEKNSGSLVVS